MALGAPTLGLNRSREVVPGRALGRPAAANERHSRQRKQRQGSGGLVALLFPTAHWDMRLHAPTLVHLQHMEVIITTITIASPYFIVGLRLLSL